MVRTKERSGLVIASFDRHPKDHISFASRFGIDPFTPYEGDVKWPDHGVQGTDEVDPMDGIDTSLFDYRVYKGFEKDQDSYSAFGAYRFEDGQPVEALDDILQREEITDVDVAGLAIDFCDKATVLDAIVRKYRTRIFLAGCRAVFPDTAGREAIEQMRAAGAEIIE